MLATLGLSHQRELIGHTADGNWDTRAFPLDQLAFFEAVHQRFVEGAEWSDIPFFHAMEKSIRDGQPQFKYRTLDDIPRQWERIDALYSGIERNGYKTQTELGTHRPWDEVVIALDRVGRILFVNGRHRLAIARVLGLERIPVIAGVRHRHWVEFTDTLRTDIAEGGGLSYQPLLHPDLEDIPAHHEGHDRFELITKHMPIRTGNLLDIGANRGYFCHRFEDAGLNCVAVERSKRECYYLRRLRDAAEKQFEILEGPIENLDLAERKFDVVIALNIFHHFLKTEAAFHALTEFLGRLHARHMVFEPHLPGDPQMTDAYRDFSPADFVRFVVERANLQSCVPIGQARDGRPLYVLSR